jgi:hypothetical protein
MKRIFLVILAITLSNFLVAQENTLPATKAVFVELGGAGLPYSFNFDFRFDREDINSWGMRVGAGGYMVSNGDSFFSMPIMVNRLYGKGPHYFELGFGATFFAFDNSAFEYCMEGFFDQNTGEYICTTTGTDPYNFILDVDGSPSIMGTMNFGYRRVPVDGGFMWKVNLNPIFNNNGFWPLFAGIGVGYAF